MTIKIAIVEDHPAMVLGTRVVLAGHPDLQIVSAAPTARSLAQRCQAADIVLLDLVLGDGTTPAQNIRLLAPLGARIIAYTVGDRPRLLRDAAKAGIAGVIRKSAPPEAIVEGIRAAYAGEVAASPEWAEALASDPELEQVNLSAREREVLGLYASGETRNRVAALLGISPETVADHIRRIRSKYGTANRPASTKLDLFHRAVEDGILPGA